jgi:hypothetical protein
MPDDECQCADCQLQKSIKEAIAANDRNKLREFLDTWKKQTNA